MLKNEGIETRLDVYPGLPRKYLDASQLAVFGRRWLILDYFESDAFWYPYKQLPQTKQWEHDTLEGFAWLLELS